MHLYNLTLQKPTAIYCAAHGHFSGSRMQEIAISRGTVLELIRPDPNTGKLNLLVSIEVFGLIRSLMAFRLTGGQKDYLIVGSDSGRISVLEYIPSKNIFEKVHQETYGKSGCRRIVPGQYLAMDPKGRAVMIGAIEKQRFVYIFNRDAQARLTISSPLEAHKAFTVIFDIVGVDVGFENPLFACIEMDYEEADIHNPTNDVPMQCQQQLTFYELDLGLNHVVRKCTENIDYSANLLISVPGGNDGPGGVIICCEDMVIYKNIGYQHEHRCPIPRRRDDISYQNRSLMIVCTATYKTKNVYFFLAQTDQGDVFKITLDVRDDIVVKFTMKYFDTLPISSALCVLKTGFLFCGSEYGNHNFYQIVKLGEGDDTPEFSSIVTDQQPKIRYYYETHPLQNLVQVDEIENFAPIIDCQVIDLINEDTPQFYLIKGRGVYSSLCILRHGLEVSEMAVSELPGTPLSVWSIKKNINDSFDSYIIISFLNATLVLSIGESVEEITDSGFSNNTPTLMCGLLGDDALIQIFPDGIRHVRPDKRINEWRAPGKRQIIKCALNSRQIVISLTGNEIIYFELDSMGQLNEYTERREMPCTVVNMALGPVPHNQQRSRFLAITLADQTVRMVSLDPNDCLQPLSMQALPALAEALCIVESNLNPDDDDDKGLSTLFLNIGLCNGVLLRTVIDPITGDLSDTRTRYLGSKAVKLFNVKIGNRASVMAISSRSWLSYYYQTRYHLTPLTYESLEYASSFSSEHCPEGIVAITGNTLRILYFERLGTIFNKETYPLKYTPRRLIIEPTTKTLFMIESDYDALTTKRVLEIKEHMANEMRESTIMEEKAEQHEEYINRFLATDHGVPRGGPGTWASLVRVFSPIRKETVDLYEFNQDEGAQCMTLARFYNSPNDVFLVVGTCCNLFLNPRISKGGGAFYTFVAHFYQDGVVKLKLMHRTVLDEVPGAIISFQGKLAAGIGNLLRIYELGKQKLLKKCENRRIPSLVTDMCTVGYRIIVSDAQESFHFVKYKPRENQLVVFADDTYPRWLTASCLLDYNTMAGADKFGNIFAIRLEPDVKDDIDEDPTGIKSLWDRGLLNGAPQKADMIFNIHIGSTVNSIQKCALIPGGSEVSLYSTLSGGIGVLIPFTSKEDIEFYHHLELFMRQEARPLCGRDHLWYRSYYFPMKSVVDGDMCEEFNKLEIDKKRKISEELDRIPSEISKRLEDIRTRYTF